MLTEIPNANHYSVSSIQSPSSPVVVGGLGVMNEVGRILTNNDIVLEMGIANDECILMLNLPLVDVIDIVNRAKQAFDDNVKKNAKATE